MPIDASIINGINSGPTLSDIIRQADERKWRQQQMQMQQRQWERQDRQDQREETARGSLSALIKNRNPDGSFNLNGPGFSEYADADPKAAFELIGKLDEQQRKAAEAGVKDLAAAVQWADTPDKWAVVQQEYGKHDPRLAQVPFENRQQALIMLGQMGEYLEKTKPDIRATEPGGGLYAVDPRGGGVRTLVQPNDGSQPMGAPVGGGVREGATATNPQTGEKIQYRNGQWVPIAGGGGASRVTSNFLDGV